MNRAGLAELVARSLGRDCSKAAAERAVMAVLQGIQKGLRREHRVTLSGFGTFTVRRRRAREGRDPRSGAAIRIAPSRTVAFRASPALKAGI